MTTPTTPQEQVWDKIKDIRFAMLTTRDDAGPLSSRPMTTVQKSFDGTLWFFASRDSQQALDVAASPQVNLAYADTGDDCYVSIKGTAKLTHDRARIEALWSPMIKAWFPGGMDDPTLVLIEVEAHEAEFWDVKESKPVQLFKMAKAAVQGVQPKLGEHATVSL
ncbi:pyridoxamine 5'-phosphate oxidase family protein [soil metagenome]